jgi:nucleoid-associated protein YgaU
MAADQLTLASPGTAGVDPALVTELATLRGMVEKIQAAIAAIEAKIPPAAPEAPAPEAPAPEAPEAAVAEPAPAEPAPVEAEAAPAPAPEAETPKPAEPAPAPETYTVVGGDSLSGIAGRVLGDINRWREIYDLNKDAIGENPDLIFPGLALKLPGGAPAAPAPAPAAPPAEAAAPAPAPPRAPAPAAPTYTVQSGDSLSGIAGKTLNDINRWGEIFELNRDQVSDPGQIFAGQVLKLPNGATAAAPSGPANGINTDRNAIYVKQPNNWTCGPTSLTMAAAAFGVRPANHGTVEELTGMTRTRPEYGIPDNTQIPNAARAMGLQASDSHGSSPAAVRAALQAGRGVVLNGSLGSGGHFLYVAGLNPDGSFIICDPWRPEITRMNDGELDHFAHNNPGHGNMVEIWR